MFPIHLVKPGILEINGGFSYSPSYYVPIKSIRSFVVHQRPPTVELHLSAITPSGATGLKSIDCMPEQLVAVTEFIAECISNASIAQVQTALDKVSSRITELEQKLANSTQYMHSLEQSISSVDDSVNLLNNAIENITSPPVNEEIYKEGSISSCSDLEEPQTPEKKSEIKVTPIVLAVCIAITLFNGVVLPRLCATSGHT